MPGWLVFVALGVVLTLGTCLCASISTRSMKGSVWTDSARLWGDGALVFLMAASVSYLLGAFASLTWDNDDHTQCATERRQPGGASLLSRDVTLFPVRAVCRWTDGAYDAVPSWVNPSIYASLAAAAVCATLAMFRHEMAERARYRSATGGSPDGDARGTG